MTGGSRHTDLDGLERALRAMLDDADPVPPQALLAARSAMAWRTLDEAILQITSDSLAQPAGETVRDPHASRLVCYTAGPLCVDLEVRKQAGAREVSEGPRKKDWRTPAGFKLPLAIEQSPPAIEQHIAACSGRRGRFARFSHGICPPVIYFARALSGQVAPVGPTSVLVRTAGAASRVPVDAEGRFRAVAVTPGPLSLRIEPDGSAWTRAFRTEWLAI